ncbi:MAG: PEP-CTERM sorting domain-containing protein [bacterium]|nr:PEP-CTERM sorting domain-containing protein [bacterium]
MVSIDFRGFLPRLAIRVVVPLLLLESSAFALGVDIVDVRSTGDSTTELSAGDILTVDLQLRNEREIDIHGLQLTAFGHDADRSIHSVGALEWMGGERAASFFDIDRIGDVSFGGIGSAPGPRELHPFYLWQNPDPRMPNNNLVLAIEGLTLTPASGSGLNDTGVDGFAVRDGDVHVRLRYQANVVFEDVQFDLTFGVPDPTLSPSVRDHGFVVLGPGARPVPFENDEWTVTVLAAEAPIFSPEPSAAVLLGLGLVGMGLSRRP